MESNNKQIDLDFNESKLKIIGHCSQIGHKYYSLHMCEYDTELLYPEEGIEPKKEIVLEAVSYFSKDDLKNIINSLQQIIS